MILKDFYLQNIYRLWYVYLVYLIEFICKKGCILSQTAMKCSVYVLQHTFLHMTHNLLNIFEEIFAHSRYLSSGPQEPGRAEGRSLPPEFARSVNPIPTRREQITPTKLLYIPLPSDLPTALQLAVKVHSYCHRTASK